MVEMRGCISLADYEDEDEENEVVKKERSLLCSSGPLIYVPSSKDSTEIMTVFLSDLRTKDMQVFIGY